MTDEKMKPELHCSFCGKSQEEVTVLIASPTKVYICNECVGLCNDIIADWVKKRTNPKKESKL